MRNALVGLVLLAACTGGGDAVVTPTTTSLPSSVVAIADARLDDVVIVGSPSADGVSGRIATIADDGEVDVVGRLPLVHGDFTAALLTVGDRVVWSDGAAAWAVALDGERSGPRSLGDARFVVPAVEPDRVWLVRDRTAVEVDVHGQVHDELAVERPWRAVREVERGMLVEDGRVAVATAARDPNVIADQGPMLAASRTTVLLRSGALVDVTTGDVDARSIARLGIADIELAAFADDGTLLAFVTGPPGTRRAALHVVDLAGGGLVQHHRLQSVGRATQLTWSPDGDAVYLLDDTRRVVGVPIGGPALTVARFAVGAGFEWLAIG